MYSYSISGSPMTSCDDIADAYRAIDDAADRFNAVRGGQMRLMPHYVIWEHNENGTVSLVDVNGDDAMPDDFNPNIHDHEYWGEDEMAKPRDELQRIADRLLHDIVEKETELHQLYADLNRINWEMLSHAGHVMLWTEVKRDPTIRVLP